MKNVFLVLLMTVLAVTNVLAQESQEVYSFLRLPVSAHVAALGGDNITLTDGDATVIFHNPALISNVADKTPQRPRHRSSRPIRSAPRGASAHSI